MASIYLLESTQRRGFCPVLISGERSPITLALLRGLKRGLIAFSDSPVGCSAIQLARLSVHFS